jgi:hypothetical protein
MFEAIPPDGLPGGLDDEVVYYVTTLFGENADAFQVSETIGGTIVDITSNEDLKVHVPARVVKLTDDFTVNDYGSIVDDNLFQEDFIDDGDPPADPAYPPDLDQNTFDGELYGYLTWATGGTYWDMDLLFDTDNDIDSPPANMLMQAISNDMFQKIATQVADFDGDLFALDTYGAYGLGAGKIADIDDVDLLFAKFATQIPNPDAETLAVFDLDGNGTIEQFDLIRLIVLLYYTRHGDTDLNGFVNNGDVARLAAHWQHDHRDGWFRGNFNGDDFVNAADLNMLGQNSQQGQP